MSWWNYQRSLSRPKPGNNGVGGKLSRQEAHDAFSPQPHGIHGTGHGHSDSREGIAASEDVQVTRSSLNGGANMFVSKRHEARGRETYPDSYRRGHELARSRSACELGSQTSKPVHSSGRPTALVSSRPYDSWAMKSNERVRSQSSPAQRLSNDPYPSFPRLFSTYTPRPSGALSGLSKTSAQTRIGGSAQWHQHGNQPRGSSLHSPTGPRVSKRENRRAAHPGNESHQSKASILPTHNSHIQTRFAFRPKHTQSLPGPSDQPPLITKLAKQPGHFSRRPKVPFARGPGLVLDIPGPTLSYITQSLSPVKKLDHPQPLLIVLDLNGTLLCRTNRKASFRSRNNVMPFLAYLLEHHYVMIWSSSTPQNAHKMVRQLFSEEQRSQLFAVWGRDTLRLTPAQYSQKVQVYKQLQWIWELENAKEHYSGAVWNQSNTVLIDDTLAKGVAQPHNLLELPEFEGVPDTTDVLGQALGYIDWLAQCSDISAAIRSKPFKGEEWSWTWSGSTEGVKLVSLK